MDRVRSLAGRVTAAWRGLAPEQRLAAIAALVLLLTLFLPWYQKSIYDERIHDFAPDTLTGFGSADFVMASVVLVAIGVLAMLFARGEGRGFHLPGGDGLVIMVAGGWAALLIFYRVLDHPDVHGRGATIGIQWGVFVAFLAAAFLIYAGYRIHSADRPEPPLPPRTDGAPLRPRRPAGPGSGSGPPTAPTVVRDVPPRAPTAPPEGAPRARRRRPPGDDEAPMPDQLSFDEPETRRLPER